MKIAQKGMEKEISMCKALEEVMSIHHCIRPHFPHA